MKDIYADIQHKVGKLACAPIEDYDQPVQPHSLVRVFTERSMGTESKV